MALTAAADDAAAQEPGVPTRVEAEQMKVEEATGGRAQPQSWLGTGAGQQLWWHGRPNVGDTLTLQFDLPDDAPAGPRRVWGRFLNASDYGTFAVTLNGTPAPDAVNLYADDVTAAEPIDLGVHELKGAGNTLVLEVAPADDRAAAGENMLGLDYVVLTAPDADSAAGGALVTAGAFEKIYDPSVGQDRPWYINDHCFAQGEDGTWHLFGITREEPARAHDEDNFAHASSPELTAAPWRKRPFALSTRPDLGELHLWAPHVVEHDGLYYMYYCAGGFDDRGRVDSRNYRMHLATSPDLVAWTRHDANPLFTDGFDARDPMVLRVGDEWVMYYTANDPPEGGAHVVAARTSGDLVNWSDRRVVFDSGRRGTSGGPAESPFVVRRGDWYYLFVGPRGGYRGPYGYTGTDVYRSRDPFDFDRADHVGFLDAHAPEVVRDASGEWHISHCGWGQGGVYLAPLRWHDGLDDADASIDPAD